MEQFPLFEGFEAPEEDVSTLAGRQRQRILDGDHPLAYGGRRIALHPAAMRVLEDDGNGSGPLRCGSCRHRQMLGEGHRRSRCTLGLRIEPMPLALRLPGGPETRAILPRVTGAEASVVHGWWPACTDYSPIPGE